jgi:DNA-binding CsgD family transcriptional regulator
MTTTADAGPVSGPDRHVVRGRDREREALVDLVRSGRSGVIEGPPGSGKSMLLREVVAAARAMGLVVYELAGYVEPGTFRQMNSAWGGQAGPAALAWDDPPWNDLGFLLPTTALACILTRRVVDGQPPVAHVSKMISIWLPPLALPAVADLLTDRLGPAPCPDLLALAAVAAGNPGGLVDLVAGLRDAGLLNTNGALASSRVQWLPRRTRERIQRQLNQISPACRSLIQVGAELPQPFSITHVARSLRTPVATLLSIGQEALATGLVVGDGDHLTFSHPLVREVVTQSVPMPLRAALHNELAGLKVALITGHDSATRWESLSERERQIAELIATNGLTNRQIATKLGCSTHTVNYHLRQVYPKLGINSRVQLATIRQTGHAHRVERPA